MSPERSVTYVSGTDNENTSNEAIVKDRLIAETAIVHGLAVAKRKRIDFAKAAVHVVDPFGG
ncbi:MAG TPA: hypothetical protein VM912_15090 [Terriglobales bacterium]|nr:hypothetical protein [Terriglobales bacterium]